MGCSSMDTRTLHWLKAFTSLALVAFAAAFLAIGPARHWAAQRDAINAATGHLPDVNPGMALYFAAFVVAPFIVAALVIELARLIAGGTPLRPLAATLLGGLIGLPVGLRYLDVAPALGWLGLSAWFCLIVAVFYGIRRAMTGRSFGKRGPE